jgi:hypothetical protein
LRPELAAMFQPFVSGVKGFAVFRSLARRKSDASDDRNARKKPTATTARAFR